MKASLQLRMGQQLTMTPQLQQAIRLLQLSTLDLQTEIQEALESNPLLEVEETFAESNESNSQNDTNSDNPESISASATTETNALDRTPSSDESNGDSEVAATDVSQVDTSEALENSTLSDELTVDSTWDDMYSAGSAPSSSAMPDDMDSVYQGETSDSLQDHLLWQMRLTPFSEVDQMIALAIIDAIEPSGYLTQSCEQILEGLCQQNDAELDLEIDEVEAVLKRVQHFDPLGVASRSLQECLRIQLHTFDKETPWLSQAKEMVEKYLDLLANRDYRSILKKTKLKEPQLKEVLNIIQSLEPRPGNVIEESHAQYVIPDVAVSKQRGRWMVELNPDALPKLRVNSTYASLSRSSSLQSDKDYIRSNLQEAKWFIKSIESRNETLLKVANCIVHHQQAFFEYGEEAMKPMVLNDVAEAVEMHESTISRVTTQKFMHTPRGIFELKYFFSSHVSTENGGECSSTAIRALIKKLVAAENTNKPLSDSKIADILAEQGIQVARRTIAKYRESLAIPPSNQRKSLL
ncbi:RNA polymerase factor sigma-54 [Alginatibacterium sediminis]|uniref:RNA polymerase sigma-54 factor n=1 Tax=Alginatibacterium sediminis TaxID=2164068 RepID=A0A420E9B4_9ALTE|nr:RNA polymerase factor sigma-54 [Alginatibacterium sediminis]RKF15918.1 RNA polymerase factor sigma-54 [Alginatibacterium sediminis]